MQTGVICPSLVLLTHSALSAYTALFAQAERAESQMQTGVICPLLALLAHSALSAYTAHFTRGESQTQTGIICQSLALLALCSRQISAHGIALFALQERG